MRGPWGRVAAVSTMLAVVVGLGACLPSTGVPTSQIEFVLEPPVGSDEHLGPLTVLVRAPDGFLEGVGEADPMAIDWDFGPGTRVVGVPGRPDALRLAWLGGECDQGVELVLEPEADGLRILSKTTQGLVLSCSAVGVLRAIELDLGAPIDPRFVVVVPRA